MIDDVRDIIFSRLDEIGLWHLSLTCSSLKRFMKGRIRLLLRTEYIKLCGTYDNVDALEWAYRRGVIPLEDGGLHYILQGIFSSGNLSILQLMFPGSVERMERFNKLYILALDYRYKGGCWASNLLSEFGTRAAEQGHVELLEWVRNHAKRPLYNHQMFFSSVKSGNKKMIQWTVKHFGAAPLQLSSNFSHSSIQQCAEYIAELPPPYSINLAIFLENEFQQFHMGSAIKRSLIFAGISKTLDLLRRFCRSVVDMDIQAQYFRKACEMAKVDALKIIVQEYPSLVSYFTNKVRFLADLIQYFSTSLQSARFDRVGINPEQVFRFLLEIGFRWPPNSKKYLGELHHYSLNEFVSLLNKLDAEFG